MFKGTKIYSIAKIKCPKCHKGEFLESRNFYKLSTVGNVHQKCACCGEDYEREIGFYYGAMYVSYALVVASFVAWWVGFTVIDPDYDAMTLVWTIIISAVILGPIIYAYSKIIWINLFVKYDSAVSEKACAGA